MIIGKELQLGMGGDKLNSPDGSCFVDGGELIVPTYTYCDDPLIRGIDFVTESDVPVLSAGAALPTWELTENGRDSGLFASVDTKMVMDPTGDMPFFRVTLA